MNKSSLKNITPNIKGFSHYSIQSDGTLYSNFSGVWRVIKPVVKATGYCFNNLVGDDHKRRNLYRHRLVALAYIPNPENKPCVCHKDNNPKNNQVDNLYWGTEEENMSQCIKDKRFYAIGTVRKKSKSNSVNPLEVIQDYLLGTPRKIILDHYQISTGYFYKILRTNNIALNRYGQTRHSK